MASEKEKLEFKINFLEPSLFITFPLLQVLLKLSPLSCHMNAYFGKLYTRFLDSLVSGLNRIPQEGGSATVTTPVFTVADLLYYGNFQ